MRAHIGRRRRTSIVLVAALIGATLGIGIAADARHRKTRGADASDDHARRGEVYGGLQRGRSDGPCRGAYEARTNDGAVHCSHGPDPAPDGVDVRRHRSTEEIAASTSGDGAAASSLLLPCYGDGTSGQRVQAVYVRASDVADRYASIAALIPQWAARADAVFVNSAAATGGVRHIKYVTDLGCRLSVANVVLSTTGDDTLTNTINELKAKGFNRTDRKYLILADSTVYCGIGTIRGDDRPTADNSNNNGASYARVDSGCWGSSNPVEAHELMHNLGGVQLSAPHATAGWHCTDESDRMCYPDAAGVAMTYPCSSHEAIFDCNHDDYFHTAPAPTSYLATHWNTANSVYLSSATPDAWGETSGASPTPTPSPTTSPAPTPAPTATPSPSPTPSITTSTYNDSLNKKITTRSYSVASGPGSFTARVTFTRAKSLTVRVKTASGTLIAQGSGSSPASVVTPVEGGTYIVEVTGAPASYTLAVTRPPA